MAILKKQKKQYIMLTYVQLSDAGCHGENNTNLVRGHE